MDANRLSKQVAAFVAGTVLFFGLLGIAGRMDYQEAFRVKRTTRLGKRSGMMPPT